VSLTLYVTDSKTPVPVKLKGNSKETASSDRHAHGLAQRDPLSSLFG
jgi:hypothetical protein